MLRVIQNSSSNIFITNFITSYSHQIVRWRRKPRWLPVAKSKMFRVPERKIQPEDERRELFRLHNNYKTLMRSVRKFMIADYENKKITSTADHLIITPEQEEQEFQQCLAENDDWNKKIAVIRNERLSREEAKRIEEIQERLDLAEIKNEEKRLELEEYVRQQKERAKNFITEENLDKAIQFALANPTDYNFSIDLHGNIYRGRETVPDDVQSNNENSFIENITAKI